MNNHEYFDKTTLNLLQLKRQININFQKEDIDEVFLIIFNYVIDLYPNDNWFNIKDIFFQKLPYQNIKITIIYTILAYQIGKSFLNTFNSFIIDLIKILISFKISPYKINTYAKFFLNSEIYEKIKEGYFNHNINPFNIFKYIFNYYNLEDIPNNKNEIKNKISQYIIENKLVIFNNNYNFFNVYKCLKKLLVYQEFEESTTDIELLPLFYTIPNKSVKKQIAQDFAYIEKSEKSLKEKIEDSLTIIKHYQYELPKIK